MKVLVFGEILWDVIEGVPHLGGAPLNFAAHVRQCGYPAAIISCLGRDELGRKALNLIDELDVNTQYVQWSDKETGTVPVSFVNGQPDYEITRDVAYDYIDPAQLDHQSLETFDVFYFGSLIQRSRKSAEALKAILAGHSFETVFYDVNLRKNSYTKQIIEDSLGYCTILKVNDEEVKVLGPLLFGISPEMKAFCEEVVRRYSRIKTVVITAGADGALVYHEGKLVPVPTKPVQVVDTVGAGDAFSAAFLSACRLYDDPVRAASVANEVGGFVASSRGPIPRYPEALSGYFKGKE